MSVAAAAATVAAQARDSETAAAERRAQEREEKRSAGVVAGDGDGSAGRVGRGVGRGEATRRDKDVVACARAGRNHLSQARARSMTLARTSDRYVDSNYCLSVTSTPTRRLWREPLLRCGDADPRLTTHDSRPATHDRPDVDRNQNTLRTRMRSRTWNACVRRS